MQMYTVVIVLLTVVETYELLYTDIAAHAVHAISSVNCKQSVNALFARNATKSFNAKYAGDAVNSMKTETAMKAGEVNFAYKAKHATYATFAMYAVHRHYQQTGEAPNIGNSCPREKGSCVLPSGIHQNDGIIKLNVDDGNTTERQGVCLVMCHVYLGATACEMRWNQADRGCYVHTKEVSRGNGVENNVCWVFAKCAGNEEKGTDEIKFTMTPGCLQRCSKIHNGRKCKIAESALSASVSANAVDCKYAMYTEEAANAANAEHAEHAYNALYSKKAKFAKEAVNSTFARKADNATFAVYAEYAVAAKYFKDNQHEDKYAPSETEVERDPERNEQMHGEDSLSKEAYDASFDEMEDFHWE